MKNYTPTVLQRTCPLSASHRVPKEGEEVGLGAWDGKNGKGC